MIRPLKLKLKNFFFLELWFVPPNKKEEKVEKRKPLINYDKEVTPVYFKKRPEPPKETVKQKPKIVSTPSQTEIKKPISSKTRDTQTIQKPLQNRDAQTSGIRKVSSNQTKDTQTTELKKNNQTRDTQTVENKKPIETKDTQTIETKKPIETKDTQTIEKPIETKDTQTDIKNTDPPKDLSQADPKRHNLIGATVNKADTLPRSNSKLVNLNKKEPRVQTMPTNPFEEIWDVRQLDPENQSELDSQREMESEREKERDREKEREKSRLRQLEAQREREREQELGLDLDSTFEINLEKEEILQEKAKNRTKRAFGGSSSQKITPDGTIIEKRVSSVRPI